MATENMKSVNISWIDLVVVIALTVVMCFVKNLTEIERGVIIVGILAIAGIRTKVPPRGAATVTMTVFAANVLSRIGGSIVGKLGSLA